MPPSPLADIIRNYFNGDLTRNIYEIIALVFEETQQISNSITTWGAYPTSELPTEDVDVGDTAYDTTLGQLVVCTAVSPAVLWSPVGGGGGGGITQLTGDVAAGPGAGSVSSIVTGLQGRVVSENVPSVNDVLTWDGSEWAGSSPSPLSIASERWVTTGGSDVTGDGSISAPYATVGAALASITAASPASRWAVRVGAGAFTEAVPLQIKPNVFIVGEDRNNTRITAPSVSLHASFTGAGDNRAGFANLTLIGACTFDFAAVTSSAGKLYTNNVNFNSAVAFNGFNAINQTIFFTTYFFGTFTTSGVNHGAHVSCVHSALTLNQHPSLPSIINAIGGSAGATTLTTVVNDFARRCSLFAKNFWMEPVTIDGPSSYLDATVSSLPSGGASLLNGGNLVWIDQGANRKLSNLQAPTAVNESLLPDASNTRYLGDFGNQWLFTFNYVLTSTGTDLYIITTPSSFGPSPGHAILIQPDSYGLAAGANGGNVEVETAAATGAGNSGSIVLKTGTTESGTRGDLSIEVNEANVSLAGALNINSAPGAAGEVLTSNGASAAPTWQALPSGGVTSVTASSPLASSGGATPDISLTAGTTAGDVLTWDGSAWSGAATAVTGITEITGDVTAGPGTGSQAATVTALQGNAVSSITPADGQVLTWNGSAWVPGAQASGGSGGGGQVYFFNNGVAGQAPLPPSVTAQLGLTADIALSTVTSGILPTGGTYATVAGFVTNLNAPGLTSIPAGVWDFNIWASAAGPSLNPNDVLMRALVYKWDGTTSTLLSTGSVAALYDPSQTIQYTSAALLPQTAILATDRIYVLLEATAVSNNHTITFSFGDSVPSHVHTTLPSVSGTGLVHVINGVVQSPASPVDLTAGASEITGTLPVGNGGSGLSTTPTDGQLLIGKTSTNDYALSTLTAGANISVTNGSGSITIAGTDRLAPRWVIGNQLAGDPTASQLAPFRYICDPGDGSAIATALSEASVAQRGDIFVRSGVYQLPSGTTTFVVPTGVTLRGAGLDTEIVGADDQRAVFVVAAGGKVCDMMITMPQPVSGATGSLVVELQGTVSIGAVAQNVTVTVYENALGLDETVESLDGAFGTASGGNVSGAQVLDCAVSAGAYALGPAPGFVKTFSAFLFEDALNCVIRGSVSFADYMLNVTGNSLRCRADVQGEAYKAAALNGVTHQIRIVGGTSLGAAIGSDPEPIGLKFNTVLRSDVQATLIETSGLVGSTGLFVESFSKGNRVRANVDNYDVGASVAGDNNILNDLIVDGGVSPTVASAGLDISGNNNVVIGAILNATLPYAVAGTGNELAHVI